MATDPQSVTTASRSKIEEALLSGGEPLAIDYKPSLPLANFWTLQGVPLYRVLWDAESMGMHPAVEQPLLYYKGAIANAEFEATANSKEVAEFAIETIESLWDGYLAEIQLSYDYGWGGYEILYEEEKHKLRFSGLFPFAPRDVLPLTRENRYIGVRVRSGQAGLAGFNVGGTSVNSAGTRDLWGPRRTPSARDKKPDIPGKAFWYVHNPRFHRWFGRTQLYAAWLPWKRLTDPSGAENTTDMAVYRFGVAGPVIYFPPGDQRTPSTGVNDPPRSGRDLARDMAESIKAGASIAFPSVRDENGNLLWVIEWPEHVLTVDPLLNYSGKLEDLISAGIGVPKELLEASETGSGYSGRAIPLEGFLTGQQRVVNRIIRTFDEQVLSPLILWNFGPNAWCKVKVKSLLETKAKQAQGGQPSGQQPPGPPAGMPPGAPQGPPPGPQGSPPPEGAPAGEDDPLQQLLGGLKLGTTRHGGNWDGFAESSGRPGWRERDTGEVRRQRERPVQKLVRLAAAPTVSVWQPYQGQRGGHGWRHGQTGEVRYQPERPAEHEGGAVQAAQAPGKPTAAVARQAGKSRGRRPILKAIHNWFNSPPDAPSPGYGKMDEQRQNAIAEAISEPKALATIIGMVEEIGETGLDEGFVRDLHGLRRIVAKAIELLPPRPRRSLSPENVHNAYIVDLSKAENPEQLASTLSKMAIPGDSLTGRGARVFFRPEGTGKKAFESFLLAIPGNIPIEGTEDNSEDSYGGDVLAAIYDGSSIPEQVAVEHAPRSRKHTEGEEEAVEGWHPDNYTTYKRVSRDLWIANHNGAEYEPVTREQVPELTGVPKEFLDRKRKNTEKDAGTGDAVKKAAERHARKHGTRLSTGPHRFASTQINLPRDLAIQVLAFGKTIPDEDLAADGREKEIHATLKYGLHGSDPKEVQRLLAGFGPIKARLGKASLFRSPEYDVVKLDVQSDDLVRLNRLLSSSLPHTETHPRYIPHCTIAYLRPGAGQQYAGWDGLDGTEFSVEEVIFSSAAGKRTRIKLGGILLSTWRQEYGSRGAVRWVSPRGGVRYSEPGTGKRPGAHPAWDASSSLARQALEGASEPTAETVLRVADALLHMPAEDVRALQERAGITPTDEPVRVASGDNPWRHLLRKLLEVDASGEDDGGWLTVEARQHVESVRREAEQAPVRMATATAWKPYQGPRGGQGWQNSQTGEIAYQTDMPGTEEGGAAPQTAPATSVATAPATVPTRSPEQAKEEYQRLGTKAPAFKAWFGDWSADPASASKVVNPETGEPQETLHADIARVSGGPVPRVVYHGSPRGGWNVFDAKKQRSPEVQVWGPGFYFTEDIDYATKYASGPKGYTGAAGKFLDRPLSPDDVKVLRQAQGRGTLPAVPGLPEALKAAGGGDDKALVDLLLGDSRGRVGRLLGSASPEAKLRKLLGVEVVPDQRTAEVKTCYLNIRNPYDAKTGFTREQLPVTLQTLLPPDAAGPFDYKSLTRHLKKAQIEQALRQDGYDGMMVPVLGIKDNKQYRIWVAFEPHQVKGVGNAGTFDPTSSRIDMATQRLATDAAGHEHRGKGEGGGQFTSGDGDNEPPAHNHEQDNHKVIGGQPETTLEDGSKVKFLLHSNMQGGGPYKARGVMVMVDVDKFDKALPENERIGAGGGGSIEIPGRLDRFKEFLKTGVEIQSPDVIVNQDGTPRISDGRHRFSVLRDLGAKYMPLTVYDEMADRLIEHFGTDEAKAELAARKESARPKPASKKSKKKPGLLARWFGKGDEGKGLSAVQGILERTQRLATNPGEPANPDILDSGRDTADSETESLLKQVQGAFSRLAQRARRDLASALRRGTTLQERARLALAVLEKYQPELARVLHLTTLASLLLGMRRVARSLPATAEVPEAVEQPAASSSGDVLPESEIPPDVLPELPSEGEAGTLHLPVIDEAVRDLASRRLLSPIEYAALADEAKTQVFAVAGIENETALGKVRDALVDAVRDGTGVDDFAKRVEEEVDSGTFLSEGHAEQVFRNSVMSSYHAGLYRVLDNPLVSDAFPFVETLPIRDGRLTELCDIISRSGLQGTGIYYKDDPVWAKFSPPRHWSCRCGINFLSVEQAARRGIRAAQEWLASGQPPAAPEYVAHPPVDLPKGWTAGALGLSLLRLGWVADPKWSDPSGKGRKKWTGGKGVKARYQKSQPGGAAGSSSVPAATAEAKATPPAAAGAKTDPKAAMPEAAAGESGGAAPEAEKKEQKSGGPPARAAPAAPPAGKAPSDANRQVLERIAGEARAEMLVAGHPMTKHRDKLADATFGGGPTIKTLRSTKDDPLAAKDHDLMAKAHARVGTILRIGGQGDLAKAHYAAAEYHRTLAERKGKAGEPPKEDDGKGETPAPAARQKPPGKPDDKTTSTPLPSDDVLRQHKIQYFKGGINTAGKFDIGGKRYFYKGGMQPQLAQNEVQASQLAKHFGIAAPNVRVADYGKEEDGKNGELISDWVEGQTLAELLHGKGHKESRAILGVDSAELSRNICFSYLLGDNDRHLGNYMKSGDKLVAIDHGHALTYRPTVDHEEILENGLYKMLDGGLDLHVAAEMAQKAEPVIRELARKDEWSADWMRRRAEVLRRYALSGKRSERVLARIAQEVDDEAERDDQSLEPDNISDE